LNSEESSHSPSGSPGKPFKPLIHRSYFKEFTMSHTFTPSLAGKVVVITGASSGLGEATARHLAARGAKLVLAARRTDKLQSLATELSAAGAEVLTQATDVTHMEQVQALADATLKRFGRIDVLVNNAGIMPLAPLAKLKVDEWSRMIDVNIKGVLHGIAAVLPTMTTQGDGHIINVASVAGHKLFTSIGTVYSATIESASMNLNQAA
jgi:NADP-dependent 3-hydroxy acid dehydrogenase YdfG